MGRVSYQYINHFKSIITKFTTIGNMLVKCRKTYVRKLCMCMSYEKYILLLRTGEKRFEKKLQSQIRTPLRLFWRIKKPRRRSQHGAWQTLKANWCEPERGQHGAWQTLKANWCEPERSQHGAWQTLKANWCEPERGQHGAWQTLKANWCEPERAPH